MTCVPSAQMHIRKQPILCHGPYECPASSAPCAIALVSSSLPEPLPLPHPQVHDAILTDLVYPTEIVGKRIRYRVDASKILKVGAAAAGPLYMMRAQAGAVQQQTHGPNRRCQPEHDAAWGQLSAGVSSGWHCLHMMVVAACWMLCDTTISSLSSLCSCLPAAAQLCTAAGSGGMMAGWC